MKMRKNAPRPCHSTDDDALHAGIHITANRVLYSIWFRRQYILLIRPLLRISSMSSLPSNRLCHGSEASEPKMIVRVFARVAHASLCAHDMCNDERRTHTCASDKKPYKISLWNVEIGFVINKSRKREKISMYTLCTSKHQSMSIYSLFHIHFVDDVEMSMMTYLASAT